MHWWWTVNLSELSRHRVVGGAKVCSTNSMTASTEAVRYVCRYEYTCVIIKQLFNDDGDADEYNGEVMYSILRSRAGKDRVFDSSGHSYTCKTISKSKYVCVSEVERM